MIILDKNDPIVTQILTNVSQQITTVSGRSLQPLIFGDLIHQQMA